MQYVVAVRALCDFAAKQGDLDLRFTPAPTALEGLAGHQAVSLRRAGDYESEISLRGEFGPLAVRGRADGYDPGMNRLEEVKTHRGDLTRQPANHRHRHWAQAKVYGWLLCQARGLSELTVALVYFDIGSQQETVLAEHCTAAALRQFSEQLCSRFLEWARQEMAHRAARDACLRALGFPHAAFRRGQRELAEAVYRAASSGRCLMAQAPTGIGKTVGTVFPLLKACPSQSLDKVFFLAAKTPGRQVALDALAVIGGSAPGLRLRVLELTAREKACEHPDKACHGESCPLAKGFYDRLPLARAAALGTALPACGALPAMDRASVRAAALAHDVCPYYLAQELARWADVVVADYNYYFDGSALLHALTRANEWRVGVLVDEAHNLVERARAMYTAALRRAGLDALRKKAPAELKKPLAKLARCWLELDREQRQAYQPYDSVPGRLVTALQQAGAAIADHLALSPAQVDGDLQQFLFDALALLRLAESFGDHSVCDLTATPGPAGDSVLCIRNLIPAPYLAPRFATARSVALFSATLSPRAFYRDTLGLPADTAAIEVESPFEPQQLTVRVIDRISTRFPDRQRSALPIASLIARQYASQPGNYLAFFSSFDYLQMVASQLRQVHPGIPAWDQSRRMDEAARREFLERFRAGGQGVGFAVLGGSFAEGIDLPGDRLIGAFIATLGLPQVNPVNELMKARMSDAFGAGYDYTYLFPGIRKVIQAAGRVIRTREDRGVVYLIDDRFTRPAVRALLPAGWRLTRCDGQVPV